MKTDHTRRITGRNYIQKDTRRSGISEEQYDYLKTNHLLLFGDESEEED